MARPRKDAGEAPARERMAQAFWELVEEGPLDSVKVADICRRAGVNRNTFYYHFDNVEQMARELMTDNGLAEALRGVIEGGVSARSAVEGALSPDELALRLARFHAVARNGTPALVAELRGALSSAWLGAIGRDERSLGAEERVTLAFLAGGAVAAVGELDPSCAGGQIARLFEGEVGRVVRLGLLSLAAPPALCASGAHAS